MGDKSKIEWTDATWNPIRGCSLVSAGCTNCYAMRTAHRLGAAKVAQKAGDQLYKPGPYHGLTRMTEHGPVWTGEVRLVPELLDQPLRWKRPRRIFVNSMSDLFHEQVPDEFIDKVFAVMALCPQHTFQVLTKRPERMRQYFKQLDGLPVLFPEDLESTFRMTEDWPLPNIWLGVSCEDQETADERIPFLLRTPAAVRWVSAEPLLGPVDLLNAQCGYDKHGYRKPLLTNDNLDWVVIGGESGPGARPMHPDWACSIRDQCQAAGVAFFFKQGSKANWPDFKNFDSFPKDLQIREYPIKGGPEWQARTQCVRRRKLGANQRHAQK